MAAPHFLAGLFARQLDINSLLSAGVSIASSLAPAVTSALSIQVSVVPDSTGGTATAITSTATPQSASTTAGAASTPIFTTSVTSTTRGPTSSGPRSSISSSLSNAAAAASTSPQSSSSGGHSSKTGIIVGVVVGVVALILLALLLFCCCRRRRRQGKKAVPFGKRWGSRSTTSEESGFGKNWPTDHAADVETTRRNHHPHTTVPIPAALVAGRRSATPTDNLYGNGHRSPGMRSSHRPRSALGSVSEHPEGYTDRYANGYGWGDANSQHSRFGKQRLAGAGITRKPVPDTNNDTGRTHHGLLDYDNRPASRGIGLNSPGLGARKSEGVDGYNSNARSWDEVEAVTRRPPSSQRFY